MMHQPGGLPPEYTHDGRAPSLPSVARAGSRVQVVWQHGTLNTGLTVVLTGSGLLPSEPGAYAVLQEALQHFAAVRPT
jgi:hypothetical protein